MTAPAEPLLVAATLALAIFVALGLTFARKPFAFVDRIGSRAAGVSLPLAIVFTRSGYTPELTVLAILGATVAIILRTNIALALLLIAFQLLSQLTANAVKRFVARLRPEVWHFREELGFAYPSGHAVTAIVFYIGWATIVSGWNIPSAIHPLLFVVAALWALGIGWSRVALGAHRVTNILGGYLLGTAWLCLFLALAVRSSTTV